MFPEYPPVDHNEKMTSDIIYICYSRRFIWAFPITIV